MRNNIICWITCILTCFASSNFSQDINPDSIKIYLVKEGWHTGLMIPVNDFTKQTLPVINYFDGFEYVDIGWGDEDFYQTPGFDLLSFTLPIAKIAKSFENSLKSNNRAEYSQKCSGNYFL